MQETETERQGSGASHTSLIKRKTSWVLQKTERESNMKRKAALKRLERRIKDYEKNLLPKAGYEGQYHKPGSMKKWSWWRSFEEGKFQNLKPFLSRFALWKSEWNVVYLKPDCKGWRSLLVEDRIRYNLSLIPVWSQLRRINRKTLLPIKGHADDKEKYCLESHHDKTIQVFVDWLFDNLVVRWVVNPLASKENHAYPSLDRGWDLGRTKTASREKSQEAAMRSNAMGLLQVR